MSRQSYALVAASFVTLVQELAFIRWMPGQVRVLAYFPNVVLISAFLGLGVGCLYGERRMPSWAWPASLLVVTGVAAALSGIAFTQQSTAEHLWLLYYDLPQNAPVVNGIRLPIVVLFILSAASFVPLGHFIAARLRDFQEQGKALTGYALDLLGSLLGVIAFAIVSYAGTFPVVWFAIVLGAGLLLLPRLRPVPLLVHVAAAAAILFIVVSSERARWYSPYYALTVRPRALYVEVLANGSLHQNALPLRNAHRFPPSDLQKARSGYHLPYRMLRTRPRRVLVLGAGTGNDVAVALDEGVERIDAVEIDPRILEIGRRFHPDSPYADRRVRTHTTDARAFLNDSRETYDLIVFGTLDSMTRLSALSNVRLDNFVYTAECLRAARRHLAPGGGVAMYFLVAAPYIERHIGGALIDAFGEQPLVVRHDFGMFNHLFVIGPAFRHLPRRQQLSDEQLQQAVAAIDIPTDDWPYLYLARRTVTPFYLSLIAALLAISVLAVFAVSPQMRRSVVTRGFDPEMFLFGAAFLIVETKLVTEMNLVWGATWLTSAVVFGAILLMVLIGTIVTQRVAVAWRLTAPALIALLALTYFIPTHVLVGRAFPVRLALSVLYIGLPVLFASLCFAVLFKERERAEVAFGWNMLGAVAGGLLEFSSMAIGLKAMTLLAILAYLLAMLARARLSPSRLAARERAPSEAASVPASAPDR
jgi:hypothetical protein